MSGEWADDPLELLAMRTVTLEDIIGRPRTSDRSSRETRGLVTPMCKSTLDDIHNTNTIRWVHVRTLNWFAGDTTDMYGRTQKPGAAWFWNNYDVPKAESRSPTETAQPNYPLL